MVKIELTDGEFTLVDDDNKELVKKYSWKLQKAKCGIKYARAYIDGKNTLLHRVILNNPDSNIDHINGDGLDNRKENLRLCNQSQNMGNSKLYKTNTSGHRGVWKTKTKSKTGKVYIYWVSSIHGLKNGKNEKYHQKTFKSKNKAIEDYEKAAKKYFGEFLRM